VDAPILFWTRFVAAMSGDRYDAGDLHLRLGKTMLFAAWVVGLIIVAVFFQRLLDDQQNPNQHIEVARDARGRAQVVLEQNRTGHYVASGRINDEPVVFLVDTGSSEVALPLAVARRLNLRLGVPRIAKTANGNVRIWSTWLESVDLGGLKVRGVQASVLPGMGGEEVLLGMSYLKRFELIQRGDTLTLRVPG
jgi:aspartyl protease family protein